ncbi:hypothetical protein AOLI_G00062960 [Acnodon oligacanthus]
MLISKGIKSEILDKLDDERSKITPYQSKDHYESVATGLVEKHPCLREPGSAKGWYCWVFSLKFKMGNYRQRLMAAGCPEVFVNKRKKANSKTIKKSKKGEIHFLPDPPNGQSAITSEEKRKIIVLEVQKRDPDLQLLDELMTAKFSQSRKEIIGLHCLMRDRSMQSSVELVTTDLMQSFLDGLDDLVPSLLELYKASSRRLTLSSVMQCLHKEDTSEQKNSCPAWSSALLFRG